MQPGAARGSHDPGHAVKQTLCDGCAVDGQHPVDKDAGRTTGGGEWMPVGSDRVCSVDVLSLSFEGISQS